MNSFEVAGIVPDTKFTQDLYLDEKFILTAPGLPFNSRLRQSVVEWEFKTVMSEGEIATEKKPAPAAAPILSDEITDASDLFDDEKPEEVQVEEGDTIVQTVMKQIEAMPKTAKSTDENQMQLATMIFDQYLRFIEKIFTRYVTHKELDYDAIAAEAKGLCIYLNDHRRYVLRLRVGSSDDGRSYLLNHALRSTIFAIVISQQLRMPLAKQIELAVACIVHEIGMLKLPPQVYMTDRPLSGTDRKSIFTHPVFSYEILRAYDFPLATQLGVLEHHEKLDGTGYPRRMSAEKISLYAKIMAVACSFEAITAPRFHKEPRSSYEAMVEMIKNNGRQFDESVVKALLFAVSLFPIGSYVFLQNGKIAQVVDVNPVNPKLPVLHLVGAKDDRGEPVPVQLNETNKIIRTLSLKEVDDILKSLNGKG